jgi:hypothetical protein
MIRRRLREGVGFWRFLRLTRHSEVQPSKSYAAIAQSIHSNKDFAGHQATAH